MLQKWLCLYIITEVWKVWTILEVFQHYNTVKPYVSKMTVNFWNSYNADNITVSIAWTVYVNDNGSNIWFLRDNVWNVLMFSDVWRVMQYDLLKFDGQ